MFAVTILLGVSSQGSSASERELTSPAGQAGPGSPVPRSRSCPDAQLGLAYYRTRYADWRAKRQLPTPQPVGRKPRNCPDSQYLAKTWKTRSFFERTRYEEWYYDHVLRDTPFGRGSRAWHRAVREVQRVFPGTESWLLSCSAAEGGHGRWVGYGGQGYSASLRDSDTVGGPLQFRWSTFRGMFRHALDHVRERGFIVPSHLRDPSSDVTWRSALGQALAGGWARYTGNDDSHWSASWGNGC